MGGIPEPAVQALQTIEDDVSVEKLPMEAGVFLIMIGIGGVLLPGPIGTPFLVLGVMVFFPNVYHKLDEKVRKRFPKSHRQGMKQVRRFVDDLERRYPSPH